MKKIFSKLENGLSFLSSLAAVMAGLLFGLIILFLTDYTQAFPAFIDILTSGFQSLRNFGEVLFFATPIILTGLSVGFAMKTGLFNIGASGQYTFGAFTAIFIGLQADFLPPALRITASLSGAMLSGALWAALAGLLKAYRNVHEVISCIMLNWIGIFMVNYLILNSVFDIERNSSLRLPASSNVPGLGLGQFFQGGALRPSSVNSGILFAIAAAVIVYIILDKTKFGYELKACGFNKDAANYAGINEKRNIIFSMMISGALAGLAGGLHFLSGAGVTMNVANVLATEGFTGISVALLGLGHPIGIIFAGILIAYLQLGGFQMQLFGFVPEIIEIVTAVIIYFCAFVLLVKMYMEKLIKGKGQNIIHEGDSGPPGAGEGGSGPPPENGAGAALSAADKEKGGRGV